MTPSDRYGFRLLGPLSAMRDGSPVDLGGDRPRAVLALLLVRRGRAVSIDAFAQEVWEREPHEITANLQVVISNLRRALASADPGTSAAERRNDVIRTGTAGYTLTVSDDDVDHTRFRRHATAGDDARRNRDADAAALAYSAALAEWSGERTLEGLGHYGFADVFAEAVAQERAVVTQRRIEADIALGRQREILVELHGLTRAHPLDNVYCAQYLTVLASAGRTAEAAEEYHGFRERYESQLGAAPPEELRRTWGSISRGQPTVSHYAHGDAPLDERTVLDDATDRPVGLLVDARGRRIDVAGRCVLGRVGGDLVLPDAKVSRTHAVLSTTDAGIIVSDLQSTNGTFVNGARITSPHLLADGDVIRVGDSEFRFATGDEPTGR